MSAFTELKKVKSLWHPITDEDFEISLDTPVTLFTVKGKFIIVKDIDDAYELICDEDAINRKEKKIIGNIKDDFWNDFFAYMYIDDAFLTAIIPYSFRSLESIKGKIERPATFIMYENGEMNIIGIGDYNVDGTLPRNITFAANCGKDGTLVPIKYVVNLENCPATNPQTIFLESAKPSTAYVVTSGEYSDYHIDGVFSNKKKADFFADKDVERNVEEYDVDDEQMLREERWYKVDIYIGESLEVKMASVTDLAYTSFSKYFDAVKFTKTDGSEFYSFFLAAINRSKAKAIALERFHALLPVESSHFPKLRMVRIVDAYRHYKVWESLVFGYFDYKAYFRSFIRERTQDLFLKIKDFLPKPLTQEEQDSIDWQNLSAEYCLQVMRKHGLNIEDKQDLSWAYYE